MTLGRDVDGLYDRRNGIELPELSPPLQDEYGLGCGEVGEGFGSMPAAPRFDLLR
ncbi:MAG: hypothetical protein ACYCSS_05165 [Sulfuriferula sp.]